ncbi:MAG: tRNA pseudouridine(38-40) synthase TruA [Pseudomonadales bacterium]
MRRYALGVAYSGTNFHGWQRQSSVATVQGALEQALSKIAAEPITVQGSGRTDAGVHATAQVAHFETSAERPDKAWHRGVNALLPESVQVRWAQQVPDSFHARFSASARRYQYLYVDPEALAPLMGRQAWRCERLDSDSMHRAAQILLGEQDFSAVRAAGCQSQTAMRCVHRVSVSRHHNLVVLDIQANAFLLHMVRNIARALFEVGSAARPKSWLEALLAGRDRTALGATAPPQGLYLVQVQYPLTVTAGAGLPPGQPAPLLQALGDLRSL